MKLPFKSVGDEPKAEVRLTSRGAGMHSSRRALQSLVCFALFALSISAFGQTTQVLFPVNTLFGGAAYNRPLTLTAANTLISDGQNLWAGTYIIIPPCTTNPIVSLYPDTYLLTVAGVVKPARLVVPASTNVLNAAVLITSGPLFYFGTNGFANLLAGTNLLFVTNTDGSLTLSSLSGSGAGGAATNIYFTSGTNTYFDTLNGSNRFSVPSTAFEAPGAAAAATNGYLWGSLYEAAGTAQKATNGLSSAAFQPASTFDPANAAAAVQTNLTALAAALGTVATLSSNVMLGMAGAAIAGSNYLTGLSGNGANLTNTPGPITAAGLNVTVTSNTNAATGQITYSVAASGGGSGGSATNAIGPNGGTGTNLNLTKTTTVDQMPVLYATPTAAIFYGDSITEGNFVTNGYVPDLANLGWQHFTAINFGVSSSHLTDVSNLFYGSSYSGSRAYTNWLGHAGTNYWMSFWIGINDCLYDAVPMDTNTWINSYTNMWWIAHTHGANPVVVFTIEDSMQLSASGETNRALLNSLIEQNASGDNSWVVLMNNDLILPSTNATYFLYNASANYGLHPTDYGHSLVAQALAAQLVTATNLSRGAYFNGPVWSTTGFGGNGSNLLNVPVTLGNAVNGTNGTAAIGMLGIDASGRVTSNAVPVSGGSLSSNNFVGSLNSGQVYGLGSVATLSSNTVVGLAGAAVAGSNYVTHSDWSAQTNNNGSITLGTIGGNVGLVRMADGSGAYWDTITGGNNGFQINGNLELGFGYSYFGNGANLTNTPGPITTAGANVTVTPSTNAATGQITYAVAASGGSGSLPTTVSNLNLAKITTVDQSPVLYATPTLGVLYGDTITQGNYVTNDYAADLANLGWQHFAVVNLGLSSSHLTDVSNAFYGASYSGTWCYTNWVGKPNLGLAPGTNAWVSFWVGVNDCNTWPLDTNTWIASFTNLWWMAHTNGAASVVVFTIADSTQLSAGGETNRALLNSLITQNATGDNSWVVLLNNSLILPSTNSSYYLYNATAGYGVFPNDYGHSLVAQALASQLTLQTNLSRGAYFAGPVWSTTGFGGNGSNLFNVSAANLVGVLSPTNVPVNTVVSVGSGLTLASNSSAGVQTYTVGLGSISAASPFLSQRVWAYMPSGSGTTLNGFGQTGSTSGTFVSEAESATDPYNVVVQTTSANGNYSSIGDNQKTLSANKPFMLVWRVGLTNTVNARVWMAMTDYATIAAADTARQCMGFLYTSTNGADWLLVTQNGSGHTWTDTGIPADTNSHTFELSFDGSANLYGYIDNVCVATNTTYLMTSYQWGCWVTCTTLTTQTNAVRFMQFYGQQGF